MINKKINAFLKKGKIFYDSENYNHALNNYQKTLKLDPDNIDALIGKGKTLLALDENKKALDCFNKSLKIEPSNSETLHYKGHVLDELEKFEDAVIYYEKAYEISKDPRIPHHIGLCYYNIDKWKEAISWFDKGLEEDHNDPDLLHYKGHSLQELNDHDGAIQCFTKAYELDKDVHFLTQIGLLYYYLNQIERSLEYVDRAIKVNPKDTEAFVIKSRIVGLKNFSQANDLLEAAIKIDKNDSDVWEAKGNLLWMRGKEEEARKCFAKIKGKKLRDKPRNKKEKNIEELIKSSETMYLEFKSSLSYPHNTPNNIPQDAFRKIQKNVEETTLKTIVGFLNTNGGELIIGVSDKKEILGLNKDYEILGFDNCSDSEKLDRWRQHLDNLIRDRIGKDVSSNYVAIRNEEHQGKMLAKIVVKKSGGPQFLYDHNDKDHCTFFIRNNSGTQSLNTKDAHEYITRIFGTGRS